MTLWTKYKIVVDTNVILSGLLFGGNPEKILKLFANDQIKLILSPEILSEILKKLNAFGLDTKFIEETRYIFETRAIKVLPKKKFHLVRDPTDNKFLEAALEGKAEYIITGDKDLLTLRSFRKILIVSPGEFIQKMGTL